MRRALIISGGLHLAILMGIFVGLTDLGEELPQDSAIAVGIVIDGEAELEEPPAPEVAEAAPLPERQAASRPPPPPPESEPAVEELPEPEIAQATPPEPEPPQPEPTPEPEPAPEPEPEPAPEPAPEPGPKLAEPTPSVVPRARPTPPAPRQVAEATPDAPVQPQMRPERPAQDPEPEPELEPVQQAEEEPDDERFDALLRSVENLNKRVRADEVREGNGDRDAEPVEIADAGVDAQAIAARQNAIAASARQQMEACWQVPAGLQGVGSMDNFEVNVVFRPDATAQSVQIADNGRLSADPLFRVVAESAQRAAWSCQLSLPPEMFDLWRTMTFVFDPSRAVTG